MPGRRLARETYTTGRDALVLFPEESVHRRLVSRRLVLQVRSRLAALDDDVVHLLARDPALVRVDEAQREGRLGARVLEAAVLVLAADQKRNLRVNIDD